MTYPDAAMKRFFRARLRKRLSAGVWLVTCTLLAPTMATLPAAAALASAGSEPSGAGEASADVEPAEAPEENGPAPEADGDEEPSLDERLDALLAEGADAEVYGEKENCLYSRKYRDIDVVSEDILIFSRGNNYWINQLKRSCLGLRRSMVIHTVTHGVNSLCSNDMVYANRPIDLNQGFTSSGRPVMIRAHCVLGAFQSIPEPYAQALMGLRE